MKKNLQQVIITAVVVAVVSWFITQGLDAAKKKVETNATN